MGNPVTPHVSGKVGLRLRQRFGSSAKAIIGLIPENPALGEELVVDYPAVLAEVVYAVREEIAVTIEDVLFRRIGLEIFSWRSALAAAPMTATLMATELHWSESKTRSAIRTYVDRIERFLEDIDKPCLSWKHVAGCSRD